MLDASFVRAERYVAVLSSRKEEMLFSVSFRNAKSLYCRMAAMKRGSDAYFSSDSTMNSRMKPTMILTRTGSGSAPAVQEATSISSLMSHEMIGFRLPPARQRLPARKRARSRGKTARAAACSAVYSWPFSSFHIAESSGKSILSSVFSMLCTPVAPRSS